LERNVLSKNIIYYFKCKTGNDHHLQPSVVFICLKLDINEGCLGARGQFIRSKRGFM